MEIVVLVWILSAVTAGVVASNRGADVPKHVLLGGLLGPFGVIIAFSAKPLPVEPATPASSFSEDTQAALDTLHARYRSGELTQAEYMRQERDLVAAARS